jgi:carbon-monoxide dehydrogenase large subunit
MRVREKLLEVAGEILEAAPDDLTIEEGRIYPRGIPDLALSFADVAEAAAPSLRAQLPEGADPGLEETYYFVPATVTFSSGTHVAIVAVDRETGQVEVLRYSVVDDCGLILNPTVVDGQQHGGVAHGIGNALFEEIVYDDEAQILNANFMDYLLPTASDVPPIEVEHIVHLSPLNPLGIKGAGEGAAVSPPAAIANAIVDALKPLAVTITEMPVTPEKLWRLIRQAESAPTDS